MYLLSVLSIVLCFVLIQYVTPAGFGEFMDGAGILFLVVLTIPVMLSTGLLGDLNNAVRLVFGKRREAALVELKRAKLAVDTMIKVSIWSGILATVMEVIAILHNMSEPSSLGPMISTGLLTLLYAIVVALLLLPIGARLEQRILEYMSSAPEKEAEEGVKERPEGQEK